ncbi:hypothetical protein CK228_06130 [Mesorhizobium sp. WSM4312]|uniref:hypothetical protein n=1 Tax=Mesorhizobium sp. WSM4312 TaxID=2029411 RepID=UPI000BAEA948|nr:hypothetical protein [Mesorhizobium sp. WSM4312]PBB69486.1 hypothetical protein CK228_06130 [Mesorhizobium sp. WSM4312]
MKKHDGVTTAILGEAPTPLRSHRRVDPLRDHQRWDYQAAAALGLAMGSACELTLDSINAPAATAIGRMYLRA